ncbi:MAG: signal peptidase I [Leptospiraceae bacterium]|nr:signal peptidase I [Leptospiraceae bacterium]
MKSYKPKSQLPEHLEFFKRILIRISLSLFIAVTIAYAVKFFFFFPYTITNEFMAPSFKKGSKVYISHLFSKDKLLIGDVILVKVNSDSSVLLARVVGRKGDRISIKNKKLFRNGNQISETNFVLFTDKRSPFSGSFSKRDNLDEVLVKEKSYFLLADNRDEGIDSRELGLISQDSILGKVLF